jgi:hypothetical protein
MLAMYVSTLEPEYSRSGVFFNADPGEKIFIKFPSGKLKQIQEIFRLKKIYKPNDACIILMSPNHLLAPLFRALTNYQVILDAGWPLSDSTRFVPSRRKKHRHLVNSVIDKTSFTLANKVILESKAQVKFVKEEFQVQESKLFDLFTGFNEVDFEGALTNPRIPNECDYEIFLNRPFVFFRGKYNSESGLDLIIESAKLTQDEVFFVLVTNTAIRNCPENVIAINRFVSKEELVWLYANCRLVLGQMSDSGRLEKTLPHKLFEASFFSKCYISPSSPALLELLDEDSFIPVTIVNSEGIAQSIKVGLSNHTLRFDCEKRISESYFKRSSQLALGLRIRELIELKI